MVDDRIIQNLLERLNHLEALNETAYKDMKEMAERFAAFASSYADMCTQLMNLHLQPPPVQMEQEPLDDVEGGELYALPGDQEG